MNAADATLPPVARQCGDSQILAKQSVFGSGVKVSVLTVADDKVDCFISISSGECSGDSGDEKIE